MRFERFFAYMKGITLGQFLKPLIRDYVASEEDFLSRLDEMCEQAFDDQCTGANPRYPLIEEIKTMYLNAYYGNKANIAENK